MIVSTSVFFGRFWTFWYWYSSWGLALRRVCGSHLTCAAFVSRRFCQRVRGEQQHQQRRDDERLRSPQFLFRSESSHILAKSFGLMKNGLGI